MGYANNDREWIAVAQEDEKQAKYTVVTQQLAARMISW
jgi:hypothetical protein